MFCRYCGNEIPDDSCFCTKCGKPLGEVNTSAETVKHCGKTKKTAQVTKTLSGRTKLLLVAAALVVIVVVGVAIVLGGGSSGNAEVPGMNYDYDIPYLPNGDIDWAQVEKDAAEGKLYAGNSSENSSSPSSGSSSNSSSSASSGSSSNSSSSPSSGSSSNSSSSPSSGSSTSSDFYNRTCSSCGGDGDCNSCSGKGYKELYTPGEPRERDRCWRCSGSGNCDRCGGDGKM